MRLSRYFKKVVITSLTLAMVLGGSTSAFADSNKWKGKEHDKGRHNHDVRFELTGYKGKFDIKIEFNDVRGADVEWAIRHIASLAAKRVFEGYEDGTFQPRKPITRIEAITAAVRLMGLREQAESPAEMNSNLNFKDAAKIKEKYPWAVGYVAVAAENDLFLETDNEVNPDKPADRLWATTLLVKALKLENEAMAKMNTKLSFADAREIPAGSVGYVAVAVEKGLINGYEDNTFRPNRPVTRAELAALLDRTGTQLPDYNNNVVNGQVSALNGNVLTVVKAGQTKQIALHSDVVVLRNGARVNASDLKVGDEVKVTLYNNTATLIEVTKPVEQENQYLTAQGVVNSVNGNVVSVVKTGETAATQYVLHPNSVIIRGGTQVNASALKAGDEVKLYIINNTVSIVEVTKAVDEQNQFTVNGKFHSLTLNHQGEIATISVTQSVYNGTALRVYNVAENVTIIGNPAQLVPDQNVELKGTNNIVNSIEIK